MTIKKPDNKTTIKRIIKMSKKVTYHNLIIIFLVIVAFAVSVSVAVLSHKTDKVEHKVDSVEEVVTKIII